MAPEVHIGPTNGVRPVLRDAHKSLRHSDLTFVCQDGRLSCHQLVIGSQSKLLKRLMLDVPDADAPIVICLPEVEKDHMAAVVKFLYTGKFILRMGLVPVIKDLLEKVLHIDARLQLPENVGGEIQSNVEPRPPPPPPSNGHDPPPQNTSQGGHSNTGGHSTNTDVAPESSSYGHTSMNSHGHVTERLNGGEPVMNMDSLPPSPPHSLTHCPPSPMSDTSSIMEVERERSPTPELVTILSDDDEAVASDITKAGQTNSELEVSEKAATPVLQTKKKKKATARKSTGGARASNSQRHAFESSHDDSTEITSERLGSNSAAMNDIQTKTEPGVDDPIDDSFYAESIPTAPSIVSKRTGAAIRHDTSTDPPDGISEDNDDHDNQMRECDDEIMGDNDLDDALDETIESVPEAPRIIAKSTGGRRKTKDLDRSKLSSKSTGGRRKFKSAKKADSKESDEVTTAAGEGSDEGKNQSVLNFFAVKSTGGFAVKSTGGGRKRKRKSRTSSLDMKPKKRNTIARPPSYDSDTLVSGLLEDSDDSEPIRSPSSASETVLPDQPDPSSSASPANQSLLTDFPLTDSVPDSFAESPLVAESGSDLSALQSIVESDSTEPRRATRASTGSLPAPLIGNSLAGLDVDAPESTVDFSGIQLPPVIPEPPVDGMVIVRGKWEYPSSRRKRGGGTGKVKRHVHDTPTITGVRKESTLMAPLEERGIFECHICHEKYDMARALKSHMSRAHNPNARHKCPECPKMLASQSAIRKHLLSHRPEHMWPYQCILCGKKFQARGDLPKHLRTNQHKDECPPEQSEDWLALIYYDKPVYNIAEIVSRIQRRKNPAAASSNLIANNLVVATFDLPVVEAPVILAEGSESSQERVSLEESSSTSQDENGLSTSQGIMEGPSMSRIMFARKSLPGPDG